MRTSEQAVHQILWDARLAPERFELTIDVHRPAPKRIALPDFEPGGDIPWHRVLSIELDRHVVWDRSGTDRLDAIARDGLARPRPLRGWRDLSPHGTGSDTEGDGLTVVTWNTLWDRFDDGSFRSAERWPRLVDRLFELDADLIALQEVQAPLHDLLLAHPAVTEGGWWLSHGPNDRDLARYGLLMLSRRPAHQVALLALGPHKAVLGCAFDDAVVITTHLTSDHARKPAATRARQLGILLEHTTRIAGPLVVLGDFNVPQERSLLGLDDAWLALHEPQPTFDPPNNPLAAIGSPTGRATRLDRVLLRRLHAVRAERLGTDPVGDTWLSDHYGLRIELSSTPPGGVHPGAPVARAALAWLPSDPSAIDAVRQVHDPSFERWPAHVNVLWGFVDESELTDALPVLDAAVADLAPFETTLESTARFDHSRSSTHGLAPEEPAWQTLHTRLQRAFPATGRAGPFRPHLTFARTEPGAPSPEAPAVHDLVTELVWLTRRGDEPFAVRAIATLGGPVGVLPEAPWLPGDPHEPAVLAELLDRGARLVGSRALGIALDGSDIDLVWPDATLDEVHAQLTEAGLDALRAVDKAGEAGFHGVADGVSIDVLPDSPRARVALDDVARLGALDPERFVPLARTVKAWARAQGLDDAAWGGLEGLAWAVLVARTPATDDPVHHFFATWAAHDWTVGVGLDGDLEGPGIACPGDPARRMGQRLQLARFEAALLQTWEALDHGAPETDLFRPFSWHRRYATALHWVADDAEAAGRARGRGRDLLQRTAGVILPGHPDWIGVPHPDPEVEERVERWARSTGVRVEWSPSHHAPSPGSP